MNTNKKGNIAGLTIFGVACAAAGAMLYSTCQMTADRAKQHLLYSGNPPAEYSFPDPYGVAVDRRLSPEGKIETYIMHVPSKREYLIGRDMLPDTSAMLKSLSKRIYKMQKDEIKETQKDLTDIVAELGKL